jgi:hypothetical protein
MERAVSEGAVYLVEFLNTRTPEERDSLLRLLDVPPSADATQTVEYLRGHVMQANVTAAQQAIATFLTRVPWQEPNPECRRLHMEIVACSTDLPLWTPRTAFVPYLLAQAFDKNQNNPPQVVVEAPFFDHVFGPVLQEQVDLVKNFSLAFQRSRVLARWKMMAWGNHQIALATPVQ